MLSLTVLLLVLSIFAHLGTVGLVLSQWKRVGTHRLAWACLSLALVLMVQHRLAPLEMALATGLFDFSGALVGFLVSLLLLVGLFGLRRLLGELFSQRMHLEKLAGTDHLTGLFNRSQLFERAYQEILRAQRSGEPLALLLLDLDHFKAVNERYSYTLGDTLLQAVADALRTTLRRVDIAGRIGGEEFLVLLPNTSAESAAIAAERLRRAVAAAQVEVDGESVAVTTCIGVTVVDCQTTQDVAAYFRGLLHEADTALYLAMQRGPNQIEFWAPEMMIQAS